MKSMDQVVQRNLLRDVWKTFRDAFEDEMDTMLTKQEDPAETGRIDAEVLWNSLEKCKDPLAAHFGCEATDLFCRAEPTEGTSWQTMSRSLYGWRMREYMLDFSITMGAIPVVIGQAIDPPLADGEKYEMLLGVESEMGFGNEILRDLLKLLDVKARVKMLLYKARTYDERIRKLKCDIEAVFNRHAGGPAQDAWLVVGIPPYVTWMKYAGDRTKMPRQLYTVGANSSGTCSLTSVVNEWWNFDN